MDEQRLSYVALNLPVAPAQGVTARFVADRTGLDLVVVVACLKALIQEGSAEYAPSSSRFICVRLKARA